MANIGQIEKKDIRTRAIVLGAIMPHYKWGAINIDASLPRIQGRAMLAATTV